jgi:hypothetical protein
VLSIQILVEADLELLDLQVASLTRELRAGQSRFDYFQHHHAQLSKAYWDKEEQLRKLQSAHR